MRRDSPVIAATDGGSTLLHIYIYIYMGVRGIWFWVRFARIHVCLCMHVYVISVVKAMMAISKFVPLLKPLGLVCCLCLSHSRSASPKAYPWTARSYHPESDPLRVGIHWRCTCNWLQHVCPFSLPDCTIPNVLPLRGACL